MKKIIFIFIFLNFLTCFASHLYKENYYQKKWCNDRHGILEYKLHDDTRVDCLTKDYAVEFDFAPKWAESIGQSLYYAQETNKIPAIVLIIEKQSDFKYFNRAKKLAQKYDIQLWYMEMPNEKYENIEKQTFENILYNLICDIIQQIKKYILNLIF